MDKKEILVIVLIGVLLLTAGLQTVQLIGLTSAKVSSSSAGTGAITAPAKQGSSGGASVPANLQNLPSMVGGC